MFSESKQTERAKAVVEALRGFEIGDMVTIALITDLPAGRIVSKHANGRRWLVQIAGNEVVHDVPEEHLRHAD